MFVVGTAFVILAFLMLGMVLGAFDNSKWYRRMIGGHWEKWEPGFVQPYWWIHSPTGRCSGDINYWNGHRRTECEQY